jgi:hypothetical protein
MFNLLTRDEARRITINIAKLPDLLIGGAEAGRLPWTVLTGPASARSLLVFEPSSRM